MARITYQRFFRRYLRLSGMSGTVRETAPELWADYGLKVALVPRNRPNLRRNRGHVLYPDAASKWAAVAEAVRTVREGEADRKSTRLNSQSLMRISYAVFCLK